MIDLRKSDDVLIKQLLKKNLKEGTKVWAYGSRIKDNALPASDLDLVIISPENEVNDLINLKEQLQNSNVPIFVQVFDWSYIPSSFKENILKQYEVFLEL